MAYVVAILVGLFFGALDQYLGTVHVASRLGWWTITVSGMSAPWLILPFLVGTTQDRARRAATFGLVATMSALLGYFAMSNGPLEGVPAARFWPRLITMATTDTNLVWIAGGVVTGPLFGYFGHRWRVARSWVAAVLVASSLCLEPLARRVVGERFFGGLSGSPLVWSAEIGLGVVVAALFTWAIAEARRADRSVT